MSRRPHVSRQRAVAPALRAALAPRAARSALASLVTLATLGALGALGALAACADPPAAPALRTTAAPRPLAAVAAVAAAGTQFCNATPIAVPASGSPADFGPASPFPSAITVSGLASSLTKVTVTLKDLSHAQVYNVDVLLVGPDGTTKVVLLANAGGAYPVTGLTVTFDDAAPAAPPLVSSGAYRPPASVIPLVLDDVFGHLGGLTGPYSFGLSTFAGRNPNGTWQLYVVDIGGSYVGQIAGGWCLDITADVLNTPPVVGAFAGATLVQGQTYTAAGAFTDPDADSWTATVDYGAGAAPLALAGKTFALSHTYAAAGNYTVTVTVTDSHGASGTNTAAVTVLTPAQALAALRATVAGPGLPNDLVTSLGAKLDAAAAALARGSTSAACGQLGAFVNQVQAQRGKAIPEPAADALLATANAIRAALGC
jgi:subtilisin-like proprotein convertase family protein